MKNSLKETFLIQGDNLSLDALHDIFYNNKSIDLTPQAWTNVCNTRSIVIQMMSDPNKVVYGINTGFGNLADKVIHKQQRKQLQKNLICSHSVGVGQPLPLETVRIMMLLRINTLAKARSGISQQVLKQYIEAFNSKFIPYIPQQGTVGASGDLSPLSHLALGMLGLGKAWDQQTKQFIDSSQVLKKLNLNVIDLNQKQGICLINGTQFMTSILSQVLIQMKNVLQSAIVILSMAVEVFGIDYRLFKQNIITIYQKNNPTLAYILRQVKQNLNKQQPSQFQSNRYSNNNNSNKESQSLIQAFEGLAGIFQCYEFCKKIVENEMNSATDNPLVYSNRDGFSEPQLISAGNFHGEYVAKAADFISIGLFNLGKYSQARNQRYINGNISNLPPFLIENSGLNSGLMIAQYTSAALLSENKVLVKPASVDTIPTSASQQDHVSMGGYASRKCKLLLENVSFIMGIQMLFALQAIDLGGLKVSDKLQNFHSKMRKIIPKIQSDIYFGPYLKVCQQLVKGSLKKYID